MTDDSNSESTKALLKDMRKNGHMPLEKLFDQNLSWDEEVDRLNHEESFVNAQLLDVTMSTPIKRQKTSFASIRNEEDDHYVYEPTVHTGRFLRFRPGDEMHFNKLFPPKLFQSKAKENLRNLFEAGRNSASIKRNAINSQKEKKPEAIQKAAFSNILYDFLSLAILGISMAFVSLLMDFAIEKLGSLHIAWLDSTRSNSKGLWEIIATYSVWVLFAIILTSGSSIFVHYFSPQAIGSGIPEMKTILRGVILKEYLSFRTMISKIVGLTLSLGSGMPIGKEGPFVHIASVMANLLSKVLNSFDSVYINESRRSEMLSVGCAVGVACVFSAPVGGVLFSIEATSVYFAVRNYWRGFFAAACAATTFRLLRVLLSNELTVIAYFQTHFPKEAFFPEELPIFALIGLVCGVASAGFIALHRKMVLFLRSNNTMKKIFQKHWYIYPIIVSFIISSFTYPRGAGQLLGGERKFGQSAKDFFQNCTWSAPINSSQYCEHGAFLKNWTGTNGDLNIFLVLSCFIVGYFFLVCLASTLPIPAGTFGPAFTIGAAFGRLVGEIIYHIFPKGVRGEDQIEVQVYPGVYSVVGAAAFCGGLTQTISVAVIIFELTGQLVALLPVMIAVLIANAVCSYLQPSIYDSIIQIKHLPFLPDLRHSTSNFHGIKVEQFMTSSVQFLTPHTTYEELQRILISEPHLKALPVVENKNSMILLGSSNRKRLIDSLDKKVGTKARQAEAFSRLNESFDELERRRRLWPTNDQTVVATDHGIDLESGTTQLSVPNKLNFYYNDLPDNTEVQVKNDNEEQMRKMSRFTVTNVLESSDQDKCSSCSRPRSRRNSSSESSESDDSKKSGRKRNGTFASNVVHSLAEAITHLSTGRHGHKKKFDTEIDLHGDDRKKWERDQLAKIIDLTDIVDSAPFQLTANTSLLKVHSLFSLIGLNRAYVTKHGRLIGVVSLKDIRIAIEMVHQNKILTPNDEKELEIKRRMRSMSIKEEEELKNDRLHPRLQPISRNPTLLSLHDAAEDTPNSSSFSSTVDKRSSMPALNHPNEHPRRPWQSISNPFSKSASDLQYPTININITPPEEDDEAISIKSLK